MSGFGSPAARPIHSTPIVFAPSRPAQLFSRPTIRVISRANTAGAAEEPTITAHRGFRLLRIFGEALPQGQYAWQTSRSMNRFMMAVTVEKFIGEEGYSYEFGAREVRRLIRTLIENPLSEQLLTGEFKTGTTLEADVRRQKVVFTEKKRKTETKKTTQRSRKVTVSS